MHESAAAKLPLVRGNCGDFNRNNHFRYQNKRVKRQKNSSRSTIQPSLGLHRYLEFIPVSWFLIPICYFAVIDAVMMSSLMTLRQRCTKCQVRPIRRCSVLMQWQCFHLVQMHWESDTKWGGVGEISRQAGIFSVKYRAIFRPDFNQYSAHILPTKCNRDRKGTTCAH